jgi:hypothetical protein
MCSSQVVSGWMPRRPLLYASDKRPRASLEAALAEEHECYKREETIIGSAENDNTS